MDAILDALLMFVVVAIAPWPYLDLWHSSQGGMKWFLMAKSPSRAHRFTRTVYVALLITTLVAGATGWMFAIAVVVVLIFALMGGLNWLTEERR